jgi:hypothetical protein
VNPRGFESPEATKVTLSGTGEAMPPTGDDTASGTGEASCAKTEPVTASDDAVSNKEMTIIRNVLERFIDVSCPLRR